MNQLIEQMLSGHLSDEEIAAAIITLREKGESADDICEYVKAINRHSKPIAPITDLMDVCGTGGSGLVRFNVSTASAFVVSALGARVIKHGNRGSQRPNGSFDLLESLGIRIEQTPQQVEQTIEKTNLGFVFAKHYHPNLRFVAQGRRLSEGRSIFNLAGPLSNPAKIRYQVIGTADPNRARTLAEACIKLGRKRAMVVYGEPVLMRSRYQVQPKSMSVPTGTSSNIKSRPKISASPQSPTTQFPAATPMSTRQSSYHSLKALLIRQLSIW